MIFKKIIVVCGSPGPQEKDYKYFISMAEWSVILTYDKLYFPYSFSNLSLISIW